MAASLGGKNRLSARLPRQLGLVCVSWGRQEGERDAEKEPQKSTRKLLEVMECGDGYKLVCICQKLLVLLLK